MPYEIVDKHPQCSPDKPFGVAKKGGGKPIGCHVSHDKAAAQIAALEASEKGQEANIVLEARFIPRHTEGDEQGADFAGREWDVTIIGPKEKDDLISIDGREFVKSRNGRLYAIEGLQSSVGIWDGIKVYDNHLTDEQFDQSQGMRSPAKEWLGTIVKPAWNTAKKSVEGVFKVIDRNLATKLKDAWDAGVLGAIGLSIDSFIIPGPEVIYEGNRWPVIEGFKKALSVDLVGDPAAGGGFNRLIAATVNKGATTMEEDQVKQLIADTLKESLPAAVAEALAGQQQQEAEEPTNEPEPEAEPEAEEPEQPEPEGEPEAEEDEEPEGPTVEARLEQLEKEMRQKEAQQLLDRRLTEAKLQPKMEKLVRDMFAGREFKEAELNQFIKQVKEAEASLDPTGRVNGSGNGRGVATAGLNEQDRYETEFMRLVMGNNAMANLGKTQEGFVQERISEAYKSWEKAGRPRYQTRRISEWVYNICGGNPLSDERAAEAVTTSGMSSIVKNAMNVMLANDYARRHRWWEPLVNIEEVDTIDQATLVRVYGIDTLDVVSEGAAYTESTWADEEETAAFVKRGNYVGVTIEAMLRDKVQAIRTLPTRLATAWYNTISALVSGVFTVNTNTGPVLGTTGALFNATAVSSTGGHANLLTAALSYTNYDASAIAMAKQTDMTSGGGQKLLIRPKFLLVPVDLRRAALQIRNSELIPGSGNNDINPYYQSFDVVEVPNWTDTNDWALVADPAEFPAIWLIFLTGNQVPSIFTADSDTSGAVFTNDTLRYKVRMMTYRFSSTYDCAPVSDFRPLHKNNV